MTHTSQISLCSDIATANLICYPIDLITYFVFTFTSFFDCFSVTFCLVLCASSLSLMAIFQHQLNNLMVSPTLLFFGMYASILALLKLKSKQIYYIVLNLCRQFSLLGLYLLT